MCETLVELGLGESWLCFSRLGLSLSTGRFGASFKLEVTVAKRWFGAVVTGKTPYSRRKRRSAGGHTMAPVVAEPGPSTASTAVATRGGYVPTQTEHTRRLTEWNEAHSAELCAPGTVTPKIKRHQRLTHAVCALTHAGILPSPRRSTSFPTAKIAPSSTPTVSTTQKRWVH